MYICIYSSCKNYKTIFQGLNLNPAIVAAALNQWGLIGNMQNQNQDQVSDTQISHISTYIQHLYFLSTQSGNQPWSRQQGGGSGSQGPDQKHYI